MTGKLHSSFVPSSQATHPASTNFDRFCCQPHLDVAPFTAEDNLQSLPASVVQHNLWLASDSCWLRLGAGNCEAAKPVCQALQPRDVQTSLVLQSGYERCSMMAMRLLRSRPPALCIQGQQWPTSALGQPCCSGRVTTGSFIGSSQGLRSIRARQEQRLRPSRPIL